VTRVLVVEDEESFSDALTFMLEREGYEVAVAADGNAALEEYEKSGADILLLDLMLPGLPGTEVCRQIRTRSQVPIIMLTAKDGEVLIYVATQVNVLTLLAKRREIIVSFNLNKSRENGNHENLINLRNSSMYLLFR
jgi:DNA-binding response OmpR family regulator